MQTYIPPVNPLHKNPYKREDMWWLDDAWNDATLTFFKGIAEQIASFDDGSNSDFGRKRTPGLETAVRFARSLELNLHSNLPGMLPSGDWLAEFLLSLEGFLDDPEEFRAWGEHPQLSKAARLYVYIESLRLKEAATPWAWKSVVSDLLLKFPVFTEADLQFLVVDGGASLGIVSRSVALTYPLPELRKFSTLLGSAYENGAVTGPKFKALLSNHSFATSSLFPAVVDFIAEERNNPLLKEVTIYEEQKMLFEVALNPVTPTAVLESLVRHFRPELTWVMRWDKRSRVTAGRFSWSDEAILDAEKLVTRRAYDELRSVEAIEVREFFNAINYHPNWTGGDRHAVLPPYTNNFSLGAFDWALDRPTVREQEPDYVLALASTLNKPMSTTRTHLIQGAAYCSTRESALKEVAEAMAKEVLLGNPVNYVDLCQVGFGIGSVLGAYQEVTDQLGGSAENIPVEWILELSS